MSDLLKTLQENPEVVRKMLAAVDEGQRVERLTNEKLIEEVITHVLSEMDMFGKPYAILDELLDRFRTKCGIIVDVSL